VLASARDRDVIGMRVARRGTDDQARTQRAPHHRAIEWTPVAPHKRGERAVGQAEMLDQPRVQSGAAQRASRFEATRGRKPRRGPPRATRMRRRAVAHNENMDAHAPAEQGADQAERADHLVVGMRRDDQRRARSSEA